VLLIAAALLYARQEPSIRVEVRQVVVPVFVTDSKGHHVTGLHTSDFRILEDGVPQEIASFSTDAGDPTLTAQPASAPRHTYVICLDTLHTSAAGADRIRHSLESLFEKERTSNAQYVLIAIGRKLQVLVPATTNPLALVAKIRGPAFANAFSGLDSSTFATQVGAIRRRMDEFCRNCACGAHSNPHNCASEIDNLKQSIDTEADRWAVPAQALLDDFKSVVEELAKLPTGRTLILISDGFSTDARREFYAAVSAYLPNNPQFHLADSPASDPDLRAVLKTASDRNIVIDTINSQTGFLASMPDTGSMEAASSGATPTATDPLGTNRPNPRDRNVQTGPLQTELGHRTIPTSPETSATMEYLAHATGGLYLRSYIDLAKPLRSALAEGREYYVLAYTPKNGARDGKYRTITVETTGKNLTLRAKPGYWAPGDAQ